jgi:hypothetical protein
MCIKKNYKKTVLVATEREKEQNQIRIYCSQMKDEKQWLFSVV